MKKIILTPANYLQRNPFVFFVATVFTIGTSVFLIQNHESSSTKNNTTESLMESAQLDCSYFQKMFKGGGLYVDSPQARDCLKGIKKATSKNTKTTNDNLANFSDTSTKLTPSSRFEDTPTYSSPRLACDQAAASRAKQKRDSNLAYENSYHDDRIQQIGQYYAARGLADSSYRISAESQENQRHENEVNNINNQYQADMAAANC